MSWLRYKFTNPVKIKRVIVTSANGSFKIQGSNNGTTWIDLSDSYGSKDESYTERTINISDDLADNYLYYQVMPLTEHQSNAFAIRTLQFYGRQLTVSVPKMTSNTEPWGEVIHGNDLQDGTIAYKAFDPNNSTQVFSNAYSYIGYDFENPTVVKFAGVKYYNQAAYTGTIASIEGSNDKTVWNEIGEIVVKPNTLVWGSMDDSDTPYRYWRLRPTNMNLNLYYLQFYGLDYSEHEERHWIYDHGVEVESVSATNTSGGTITKTDDEIKINRVMVT